MRAFLIVNHAIIYRFSSTTSENFALATSNNVLTKWVLPLYKEGEQCLN